MSNQHAEKVLVVDDSSFMRQIVVQSVKGAGFANVIEAENGLEAIEIFEKEKPDVILMDLIMPNMTGIDVLKTLVPKGAKIIVISAIGQKQIIEESFKSGARGYFIKPFFAESDIKVMIESVLKGEIVHPDSNLLENVGEYVEVALTAAEKSSNALTRILGEDVEVMTSGVEIKDVSTRLNELSSEKNGLVTAVTGLLVDAAGAVYISLRDYEAFLLVDLLNKRGPGTTTSLDEDFERSTIEEVLNILSNSYLSVFDGFRVGMLAAELPHVVERSELRTYVEKFLNKKKNPSDNDVIIFKTELSIKKHSLNIDIEFLIYKEDVS